MAFSNQDIEAQCDYDGSRSVQGTICFHFVLFDLCHIASQAFFLLFPKGKSYLHSILLSFVLFLLVAGPFAALRLPMGGTLLGCLRGPARPPRVALCLEPSGASRGLAALLRGP